MILNFYQKIYGLITMLILGTTAVIFFVGFDTPYSGKFIVEMAAIFLSELIFGVSVIAVSAKNDNIMFHSAGYSLSAFFYFVFSLLMGFAVSSSWETRYFVIIHIVGLVITIIFILFYFMTEHNFCLQETADGMKKQKIFDFQNMITEIKSEAEAVFVDDPVLLKALDSLAEDCRYAADPSEKTQEKDREIMFIFDNLREIIKTKDRNIFLNSMGKLRLVLQTREQLK